MKTLNLVTIEATERLELAADDVADTLAYSLADGTPVAYLNGYTNGDASALWVNEDGTTRKTPRLRRSQILELIGEWMKLRGMTLAPAPAPAPAPALVPTMANENSGVPAKLRMYGPLAAAALPVKCHPANDGGATLDLASDTFAPAKHTTGYYVAGLMPAIEIPAAAGAGKYAYAIARVFMVTSGRGLCGFWNENGTVYAEASEWVADKTAALELAAARNELAVWDVAASKSIYL